MSQTVEPKKQVRIGDYLLTSKIGQGGIAEIYKARQDSLNRDVAIKILSPKLSTDEDIIRRFERESEVIAKLNHPNIVHVIDKGTAGNRYYFVMEFVDGTSLREVIDTPGIATKTVLEMLVQVCKALDYAHKNGVIHRDIKPANILIDRQGNPRVADFGIAQIVGTPESEMTSSDMIMGTLAYMSPEQKVSSTNVDQTTDIYAVGVIIYETLVGKKPMGRFKLPSEIDPTIETAFDQIVQRCLAQEAKDRYQSATELKNAILEAIGGGEAGHNVSELAVGGVESFVGNCHYLDTIKETRFGSPILVENKVSKRLFVIKRHQKGDAGRKEAKLLTTLKHKNIINLLGSGGDANHTVIVAEYAQGGSLAERMVRKYDWKKAMDIILQIASGLDFAHKNNIIHGNLRPSNVLFNADEIVKLTDFGLPIHYDASKKKNWYNPPEHKQSKYGDIYSIGVILHQLLSNRNPTYDAAGNLRLDDFSRNIPDDVFGMLNKFLAIRITKRYQSFSEFLYEWDDFEQCMHDIKTRASIIIDEPLPETKQTPIGMVIVSSLGLLFIIIAVLYFSGIFR